MKNIGWGAFQNCDNLASMNIHSSTIMGKYVFDQTPNVKIKIVN